MARASIFLLLAVLLLASPCQAVHKARRLKATTKGERRKGTRKQGWRRRAQDYQQAKETTFVTNPSSLAQNSVGKGKGKGNQVTHTAEDNDGRTTFMVKCDETYMARKASGANEKAPLKAADKARKGKGGKGGLGASGVSDPATDTTEAKAETGEGYSDICDEYAAGGDGSGGYGTDGEDDGNTSEMTGGGWYSGDGGSTDGDGGSGTAEDGDVNGVVVPGSSGDGYPEYDTGSGQVEQANGEELGLHGCETIGVGEGPTTDSLEKVQVTVDVVHEIESNAGDGGSDGILRLMRADLQENVAPVIADCITDTGAISVSGSDLGVIEGGSGNGGFASSGSGSYVGYNEDSTLITNVNFTELSGSELGCGKYDTYFPTTDTEYKCMLTTIPVDLYYDGTNTSDFEDKVMSAIDRHKWNVPGLMMTSTVRRGSSGGAITAIEADQAQADDKIGAGGFVTIAAAALVLLLVALMLVRSKRRDEMVKHVSLEDDDDTYLKDIEQESNHSSASLNRLANLVGDDADSVRSGWTGASTHFRNAGQSLDAMYSNTESRPSHQDVHVCSSATCEVCERNRQSGVQFIPSGASLPSQPPLPPLPPDAPRQYAADDTVTL